MGKTIEVWLLDGGRLSTSGIEFDNVDAARTVEGNLLIYSDGEKLAEFVDGVWAYYTLDCEEAA